MTACPASEKLKGLGPQSFRKGSLVISSINKPDHCMVSSLHVFEYTFVCDSAPTAHRRLTRFDILYYYTRTLKAANIFLKYRHYINISIS